MDLVNGKLVEARLQDFVIVDGGVFILGVEVNLQVVRSYLAFLL